MISVLEPRQFLSGVAATADFYTLSHDQVLTVSSSNSVLANDSGWTDSGDGSNSYTLSATRLSDPSHGSLSFNSNGSFTYTPTAGYAGQDSFTYTASYGPAAMDATVNLCVYNEVPVANSDDSYFAIAGGSTFTYSAAQGVLKNDTDGDSIDIPRLTASVVQQTTLGTLDLHSDGSFTYEVNANALSSSQDSAVDTFTYTCSDGNDTSNTATVTINIGKLKITMDDPAPTGDEIDVTNQTQNTVDGEKNAVYARISNQAGVTPHYSWCVDDNPIARYDINNNKVTYLSLANHDANTLAWYWTTDSGTKSVNLVVEFKDADGNTVGTDTSETFFNTMRPDPTVSVTMNDVWVENGRVSLGGAPGSVYGVKAMTQQGSVAGNCGWMQILNSSVLDRTELGGNQYHGSIIDAYDGRSATSNRYDKPDQAGNFYDTPFEDIGGHSSYSRSDAFSTYMMFVSSKPGSIFVPVKEFHWSWSFSAILDNQGNWVVASTSSLSGVTDSFAYPPEAIRTVGNPRPQIDWELVN